jgi:methionine synthase I (cobalamin-dependent)
MTRRETTPDPFLRDDAGPAVLDGGVGSELKRRGVPEDPVAWMGRAADAHRETLVAVHADYRAAGAAWATTATFGLTPRLLAGEADAGIAALAVDAARAAGAERVAGALSTAPPGFDHARRPGPAAERRAYEAQARTLLDAGVDALVLEMIQDDEHGGRALEAAGALAAAARRPLWLGVSARLHEGDLRAFDFPERPLVPIVTALLRRRRPDALVLMHSPLDAIVPGLRALRALRDGPLGVRPELPYPEDGTAAQRAPADALARALDAWRAAAGGDLAAVGGCCGTGPEHVAALVAAGV